MTSEGLLAELRTREVQLAAQGNRLLIDAPKGVLTPELRQRLAEHKDELLSFLSREDENPDGQQLAPSDHRQGGVGIPPISDATVQHPEDGSVTETDLAAYLVDTLAAHPVGRKAKPREREGLAEYVARSIVYRYGPPAERIWRAGQPVVSRKLSTNPWVAVCPAGHLTDKALWHLGVVGWACEVCEKVYDPRECRLIPRPHAEAR